MAVNGTITPTAFTAPAAGALIRRTDLDALSAAVSMLEGCSANVDNCGNCAPANCCQSCQKTAGVCQSCQSSVNCNYTCQSCQGCQSQCNCNCNCGGG